MLTKRKKDTVAIHIIVARKDFEELKAKKGKYSWEEWLFRDDMEEQ
jgi:hypothetical protein